MNRKVSIIGAGNFGTCLAQQLATNGHHPIMWARDAQIVSTINTQHYNRRHLREIKLHKNITATSNAKNGITSSDFLILAIPTQSLRLVLKELKPYIKKSQLVICAAKGIEMNTMALPSQIIEQELGKSISHKSSFLSGPSFAIEVAHGQPTAVTIASSNKTSALMVQNLFHSPNFRAYTSSDHIGIEIAGALKNVIAIAVSASAGLGFQANTQAALITRGLAEITRLGSALGASPLTFTGLGGVGDLLLTCSSVKSRNYTVGYKLGKGEKLKDIVSSLGSVAEGVATAKSAYQLANKLKVRASIISAVYQVLYDQKPIKEVVYELMNSAAREELEGI